MPLSNEDLDKLALAKAKESKPELWDNDPKTKPADLKKPTNPKVSTPTKDRVWDKKFQPLIDANVGFGTQFTFGIDKSTGKKIDGWDDLVNYGNSLALMKAVNGRYDSFLKKEDISESSKKRIKDLKNASWAAMNEIEKISKGTGSIEKFLQYQKNAFKADWDLGTLMGPNSKSNYVYDPDKKTIMSKAEFAKKYEGVKQGERGSTQTNVGGGGVDPYAGYIQTKGYLELSRNRVKDQVKPLVNAWAKNTYNYLNADDKTAGRIDPNNRDNALELSKDALSFISKYGTQTGNREYDKQNKIKAAGFLNKLNAYGKNQDHKIARDSQLKYLRQLTTGKTNQLSDLIDDMGYYGSTFLYKKHKDRLGKNDKYYEGAEKYWGETDALDEEIQSHEVYATQTKKDKLDARKEALNTSEALHKNMLYKNIIDDNGNIQSYHQFLKNAGWDPKTRSLGEPTYDKRTGIIQAPELYNAFNDYNSYWSGVDSRGVTTYTDPNKFKYEKINGKTYKTAVPVFAIGRPEAFHKIMRQAYNETVKSYKKRFSLLNDPKKREKDMGRGNTADKVLYYDYVDMSLDKDGNLINTEGDKHSNVSKIFNMFQNPDKTVNNIDITVLDNDDIKSGKYSKASRETLDKDYLKNQNQSKFDNFFKGKDLSQMYVEFDRNSSVGYRSTYTFVNQKTGEKLAMIAPVEYIKKNKEVLHAKTWMTVPEARFQRLGKLDLPDKDNYYKNAAIIQKNGIKYATYQYKDSDGVFKREEIALGDIQIEVAKQQFKEYFKRLAELEKYNDLVND